MKIDNELLRVLKTPEADLSTLDSGFLKWVKETKPTMYMHHLDLVNGKVKKYYYMYTFTLDPSKGPHDTDEVEAYIIKQFKRKPLQVTDAYIAKEGDGTGKHIHWHVSFSALKSVDISQFRYYTRKYGNIDPSESRVDSMEESLNYISKEATPARIALL